MDGRHRSRQQAEWRDSRSYSQSQEHHTSRDVEQSEEQRRRRPQRDSAGHSSHFLSRPSGHKTPCQSHFDLQRGHADDHIERKRPRNDSGMHREWSFEDRKDAEPTIKKFRHDDGPSRGHTGDYRYHRDYHKSASDSYHRQRRDGSGRFHQRSHSERQTQNLPQKRSREREGHKRSHTNGEGVPSDREHSRHKRHHREMSPRQKSQLPVGGATSSTPSREVVPYMSSEASTSGRGGRETGCVPSILDSSLVPSLPEKYYICDSDGRVSSTKSLSHLQRDFEYALLSAGGAIPSRWRLSHQEDTLPTQVTEGCAKEKLHVAAHKQDETNEGELGETKEYFTSDVLSTPPSLEADNSLIEKSTFDCLSLEHSSPDPTDRKPYSDQRPCSDEQQRSKEVPCSDEQPRSKEVPCSDEPPSSKEMACSNDKLYSDDRPCSNPEGTIPNEQSFTKEQLSSKEWPCLDEQPHSKKQPTPKKQQNSNKHPCSDKQPRSNKEQSSSKQQSSSDRRISLKEKAKLQERPCSDQKPHSSSTRERPALHEDLFVSVPSEDSFVNKRKQTDYGKGAGVDMNANPHHYHSYAVTVEPEVNFELNGLTQIKRKDGKIFFFQGFSVLSHTTVNHLPQCKFERFGGIYTIKLHKHPTMTNFTVKDAFLYQEFLFVKLLELYDWIEYIKPFSTELIFLPRFVRQTKDNKCEVLSMAEVLRFLIVTMKPLTTLPAKDLLTKTPGFLLFSTVKRPFCYRVDRVQWTKSHRGKVQLGHWCLQMLTKIKAQTVVEHKVLRTERRARYNELNVKKCEKNLTMKEFFELRDLKELLFGSSTPKPEQAGTVWIPVQEGLYDLNLYYDIVQHSILLPLISHHILFYDSLSCLEKKLGYMFRDVSLLQRALAHPSITTYTYTVAEDHIKNALSNGGLKWYERLEMVQPLKKIKTLIAELERGETTIDEGQRLQNNEQLEYLGDALLEYQCSLYLYLKYPEHPVGQLVKNRQDLVKNHFLQELAKKLDIQDYLLYNRKAGFPQATFQHFAGNCVETLLAAIFLDGGEEEAKKLYGRLAFSEKESEFEDWMNPGVDPVQSEYPEGDRHLIEDSDFLKSMVKLEEKCGVHFRHISLLGRALTHSSQRDTTLTMGNYQRLEFLGDAVLQFLVSKYIYHRFPAYNEGHFSMIRTALVHNKHLATRCEELGLHKFILTSQKEEVEISLKMMADIYESYLSALTLDQGLEAAEKFLQIHIFPKLSAVVCASELTDSNTRLHQAAAYTCKQQGIKVELPVYKKLAVEGTPKNPVFTFAVHYGKRELARGSGRTVKKARMLAAENALKSGIFRLPPSQKKEESDQNNTETKE